MAQVQIDLPVKVSVDLNFLRGLREIRDGIDTLLSAVEAAQPKDALDNFLERVRGVEVVDTSTEAVPLSDLTRAFGGYQISLGSTLPKD